MTVLTGQRYLDSARINSIVNSLSEEVIKSRPLTFADRVPTVDADQDEIYGTFTGRIFIADLIAHDQKAVVYDSGEMTTYLDTIPKIKIGQSINERKLDKLLQAELGAAPMDDTAHLDWETQIADNLLTGERQRVNQLCVSMMLDSVAYDRHGIKIAGTWGMPSDLKVTVATPWATSATATPIADIQAFRETVRTTYGIDYDRLTMRSSTLAKIVATTEFKDKAALTLNSNFAITTANLMTADVQKMLDLAQNILGMTIVLEYGVYRTLGNDGRVTTMNYLDVSSQDVVIVDSTANDGDSSVWDVASVPVMESAMPNLANVLGGVSRGPISYYTAANADFNPPGVVAWVASAKFPRKKVKEANGLLYV